MAILIAILALLIAAVWMYLAFTSRQSGDLGYLVRRNGYGMESAVEYEPERQAGYETKSEKRHGAEPGFRELAISEMKYKEEGKGCHG